MGGKGRDIKREQGKREKRARDTRKGKGRKRGMFLFERRTMSMKNLIYDKSLERELEQGDWITLMQLFGYCFFRHSNFFEVL